MTLSIRIKERGINAMMVALFFLALGLYSIAGNAQGTKAVQRKSDQTQVADAGKSDHVAAPANKEVNAVPLHASVNSAYAELKPTLSPDGSRLYFSRSHHPENTFGESDAEDIWYSSFDKTTNTWSDPIRMSGVLNNEGPNFINNVSITGDTLILGNQYGKKGKMRAGLSYSVNVKGQWSTPVSIVVENDYNMSQHANAFVSVKNGVIIKAIQRGESIGERDLFVSFWDGVRATEPINMGAVINSELEESSPFLAADNKTLYFACKEHGGSGGYDIFVTTRLDESWTNWSVPQNLGSTVNGALDDEFFSISPCGNHAVFSKQVSVHNVDLYKVSTENLIGLPATKTDSPSKKDIASFASL